MRKIILTTVALISLAFSVLANTSIERKAPDFTLKSTEGENLRLSEHRGEVIMINFWASWCGPCRQEMPHLDGLYQRYNKAGFKILGINVEEDPAAARKLLKDIPVTFPVLLDNQSVVSELYQVQAMPTTILLDRDGNIRYLHHGYKPGYEDKYRREIVELIRE